MLKVALWTDGNHPTYSVAYSFEGGQCVFSSLSSNLAAILFSNQIISGIAIREQIPLSELLKIKFYDLQTRRGYQFLSPGTFQYDRVEFSLASRGLGFEIKKLVSEECPEEVYKDFRQLIGELNPPKMSDEERKCEIAAAAELRGDGWKLLAPEEARGRGYVFEGGIHAHSLFEFFDLTIPGSPLWQRLEEKFGEHDFKKNLAIVDNRRHPRLMGQAAGFSLGILDCCQCSLWPTRCLAVLANEIEEKKWENKKRGKDKEIIQ